ncbi:ATP-binding protein, partial [Vibrio anguillarum]
MSGDLQSYKFRNVSTTALCLSLIGCSGSGKSSTLERILATYPQVIYHEKHNFFQLSYLKIECPNNGSQQSLCLNFFREVDKRLSTNYENTHSRKRHG